MRIALRTGAGRGAYELAGTQGSYSSSDLFNKEMFYELTPGLVVPGYAVPDSRQGKPRIKLDENHRPQATHLYRLLAALLLLPKPIRDFKTTGGDILLTTGAYCITAIKINVISIESSKTVVQPTELLLENAQGLRATMNFLNRVSRIMKIWAACDDDNSTLATLLNQHRFLLHSHNTNHVEIEKVAKSIFAALKTIHDPLEEIETRLGILDPNARLGEFGFAPETTEFGVNDTEQVSPELARFEKLKKWREVAIRGNQARRFSTEVKNCYQNTCLFSGHKLPKLSMVSSPGVDAAHILPWATHGINTVSNGICLSKQSHWALDSGLIRFSFDRTTNEYVVAIPDAVSVEARQLGFSLDILHAIEGPIPRDRLPSNTDFWPNPDYIDAFNEIMFAQT